MGEKLRQLMKLMEVGEYADTSGVREAIETKNKEVIFDFLTKLVGNIKNNYSLRESELYAHLTFSSNSSENVGWMLQKCFDEDEELDFIKDDIRYKKLMDELKSIKGKA